MRKNGHPLKTINHDQFLTKYSNTLRDQPLGKHYRVKLDLGGLTKARYPRITKTATKWVPVLSLCCDKRQEHLWILAFFKQLLTNDLCLVCVLLWFFRAFYSLSFSSYLYQVRGRHDEERARRSYLQVNMNWSNSVPIVVTIWFYFLLDKTKLLFWNNRSKSIMY